MIRNSYPTLDFDLGDTADLLRDSVRSFSDDKIAPIADEIDRSNKFPRHLWPQMGELGLLGITVEEEYGGTVRIPISASTRSAATAMTSRSGAICRSSFPASMSARWR
jgi:alkylation response protein AidB-like acyl-CoA dehydrogenase